MDYLCAKFGDFSFSRFGFIVRTDGQNYRQNHRCGSTLYSRDYRRREYYESSPATESTTAPRSSNSNLGSLTVRIGRGYIDIVYSHVSLLYRGFRLSTFNEVIYENNLEVMVIIMMILQCYMTMSCRVKDEEALT